MPLTSASIALVWQQVKRFSNAFAMTARDRDLALWGEAVDAFAGRALADIEAESGVSRSVSRRLRAGEPAPQYLQGETRSQLAQWSARRTADAVRLYSASLQEPPTARVPLPPYVPLTAEDLAPQQARAFESEAERRGYLRRVLEEAARAIADARSAVELPVIAAGAALPLRVPEPGTIPDLERASRLAQDLGGTPAAGADGQPAHAPRKRAK